MGHRGGPFRISARPKASRKASFVFALLAAWAAIGLSADARPPAVSAPPSLEWAAGRVRAVDTESLAAALARAGLEYPPHVQVTLVAEDDARAARWPRWIVGFADPPADIVIFPERATRYPYDSLESVVRHEVAHLALAARARGQALPRWFHEGVAVSIEGGFSFGDQARLLSAMVSRPEIGDVGRLFAAGTESESADAYLLATALVTDISHRHGPGVVGIIADGVGRGLTFDRAFAVATGDTVQAATATAWGGYLRWTRWILAVDRLLSTWTLMLLLALAAFVVQRRRRARRRQRWEQESAAELADEADWTVH